MIEQITRQLRIVGALAIREVNSQQTTLMYGYAWALVDVGLSLLGLIIMKIVLRNFNPPGLPPITFILNGAIPWFMFQHMYMLPSSVISKNKRLLSLPIVSELDLVFGGAIQIFVTLTIVMIVTTTISSWIENSPFPRLPIGVMLLVITCCLIGLGLGFVFLLLNRVYPPASKFIGFILRFALFLSGVYIPLTRFPSSVWPYLTWNPMLHVEELLRQYWFYSYVSPVGPGSLPLIAEWTLGLLAFGLLCERYTRVRVPVV
jgi:capsular polysaccharide transport system permease protein